MIATGTAIALGLSAAAGLAGSVISSRANSSAAEKASQAQTEGAAQQTQALREAQEKQLAFSREGQDYLKVAREDEAPGQTYLRTVVADPGMLTPAQLQALEDLRRNTRNQISTSSIAGSGRTAAALLRRTESDFTNDALERNRSRAMDAASGMANRASNAATTIGNISVGTGTQQAALQAKQGEVTGNATANSGAIGAQAELANGRLMGSAIGDIGSLIASQARQSRYGDATKLGTIY